jgi:hypothetical protein
MPARKLAILACLLVPVAVVGCRKATVESYRVPKEKDPEMPAVASAAPAGTDSPAPAASGSAMANTAVPTADGAALTWSAPAGWKAKPASAMRKGSFSVPGDGGEADLSITAFPGDVGGELANVNRWRGQVQLAPIAQADLASNVQRVEANGLSFGVVDLAGGQQRIVGAYVAYGGATWFFKLLGPDAVVANAKPEFLAFLKTVKPASSSAP